MGGATAKAKAATITSNVEACVTAVQKYYADGLGKAYTKKVNEVILEAIPRFGSFAADTLITYTLGAGDTATDPTAWTLTVNFNADSEADAIATALATVKGYDKSYNAASAGTTFTEGSAVISSNSFKVNLYSGVITAP